MLNPTQLFFDERLVSGCIYCGAEQLTREHVPSKVFLDRPYPEYLPVVGACRSCNTGYSLDEQYVACFIECVVSGGTGSDVIKRNKILRTLERSCGLKSKIESSRREDDNGRLVWKPEIERVERVVLKLARGHYAYELFTIFDEPSFINISPLCAFDKVQRCQFEGDIDTYTSIWPEIGTRAFYRSCGCCVDRFSVVDGWIVVQNGRYRYKVMGCGDSIVRIVFREYLAAEVGWVR